MVVSSKLFQKLYLIAHKYYIEEKKQQEIADELHINRVLVSRYLKQAREMGIVEIKIKGEFTEVESLKKKLIETFSLEDAGIISMSFRGDSRFSGVNWVLMAEKVDQFLQNNATIGIGWGSTLEAISRNLKPSKQLEGTTFVPLTGGTNRLPSYFHTNDFVRRFAEAYKAHAKYLFAPFVLENLLKKESATISGDLAEIMDLWKNLDIVITGIGCYVRKSPLFQNNIFDEKYLKKILEKDVVGDVMTHFYDENGNFVDLDIYDRLMNISIDDHLKTRIRIGVAVGFKKVQAIIGALRGKIINVLITDVDTAELVLKYQNDYQLEERK